MLLQEKSMQNIKSKLKKFINAINNTAYLWLLPLIVILKTDAIYKSVNKAIAQ